jgi:glucose/arabinose dehydrogenase
VTKAAYATSHGRDNLSRFSDLYTIAQNAETPTEEFFRVDRGIDIGWPYCFQDPTIPHKVLAPEYGGDGKSAGRCAGATLPLIGFPAHWGPNDLMFYTGTQFPTRYRGGAFVAFHGSWNRMPLPEAGYKVVFAPFSGDSPTGAFETFADGFAGDTLEPVLARYRPTGLAQGPDGSLYIADDMRGRIWRVTYLNPSRR